MSFSSMPLTLGWLAYPGPSYGCTCQSGYTNLEQILLAERLQCPVWAVDGSIKRLIPLVFAKTKGVDYLLMAKPVAFNQSRIRHDCAVSCMIRSVVGSSL